MSRPYLTVEQAEKKLRISPFAAGRIRVVIFLSERGGIPGALILANCFAQETSRIVREAIMEALSYFGHTSMPIEREDADTVRTVALSVFEDPSVRVRRYAVRTAFRMNSRYPDETTETRLRERFTVETDVNVRRELIRSIHGDDMMELLLGVLSDPDPAIRAEAAFYLGWHCYDVAFRERAVPELIAALDDPVPNVVGSAVMALKHRGVTEAMPTLKHLRETTTSDYLRRETENALRTLER
jgi:HEAT repeat protein